MNIGMKDNGEIKRQEGTGVIVLLDLEWIEKDGNHLT